MEHRPIDGPTFRSQISKGARSIGTLTPGSRSNDESSLAMDPQVQSDQPLDSILADLIFTSDQADPQSATLGTQYSPNLFIPTVPNDLYTDLSLHQYGTDVPSYLDDAESHPVTNHPLPFCPLYEDLDYSVTEDWHSPNNSQLISSNTMATPAAPRDQNLTTVPLSSQDSMIPQTPSPAFYATETASYMIPSQNTPNASFPDVLPTNPVSGQTSRITPTPSQASFTSASPLTADFCSSPQLGSNSAGGGSHLGPMSLVTAFADPTPTNSSTINNNPHSSGDMAYSNQFSPVSHAGSSPYLYHHELSSPLKPPHPAFISRASSSRCGSPGLAQQQMLRQSASMPVLRQAPAKVSDPVLQQQHHHHSQLSYGLSRLSPKQSHPSRASKTLTVISQEPPSSVTKNRKIPPLKKKKSGYGGLRDQVSPKLLKSMQQNSDEPCSPLIPQFSTGALPGTGFFGPVTPTIIPADASSRHLSVSKPRRTRSPLTRDIVYPGTRQFHVQSTPGQGSSHSPPGPSNIVFKPEFQPATLRQQKSSSPTRGLSASSSPLRSFRSMGNLLGTSPTKEGSRNQEEQPTSPVKALFARAMHPTQIKKTNKTGNATKEASNTGSMATKPKRGSRKSNISPEMSSALSQFQVTLTSLTNYRRRKPTKTTPGTPTKSTAPPVSTHLPTTLTPSLVPPVSTSTTSWAFAEPVKTEMGPIAFETPSHVRPQQQQNDHCEYYMCDPSGGPWSANSDESKL